MKSLIINPNNPDDVPDDVPDKLTHLCMLLEISCTGYNPDVAMGALLTMVDTMLNTAHQCGEYDMDLTLEEMDMFMRVMESRYKDPMPRSKAANPSTNDRRS